MEIYGEISMEIDVLILHGIPWRIFHGNPWNSMEFHGGFSHGNFKSDETIAVRFFNIFKIVPELHYFIYIVLLLENYLFNSFLFVKICCDTL